MHPQEEEMSRNDSVLSERIVVDPLHGVPHALRDQLDWSGNLMRTVMPGRKLGFGPPRSITTG